MSHIKQIGRYSIQKHLGGGGMSTVYVAYDPHTDTQVAVKVLRTGLSDDPDMRERFEREAQMLAQLRHPAIMPLLDYGEADGRLYFVMPYMHNGSLQDRLLNGAISFDDALIILRRIALALDVAHGRSIIHRDIKPHNIIFDDDDMAFLADFGIARLVDLNKPQQTVTLVGTPEYMAPEQVVESNISPQTDIYQLGVVLFQMWTGRRPFEGNVHSIMTQHLNDAPPLVETLMPDLPVGCDAVLGKALAKKPEDRYATIGAFSAAVMALQGQQPRRISEEHTIIVPPLFMASHENADAPPAIEPVHVPPTPLPIAATVPTQPTNRRLKRLMWGSFAVVAMFMFLAAFVLMDNGRGRGRNRAELPVEQAEVDVPALIEVTDEQLVDLFEDAEDTDEVVIESEIVDQTEEIVHIELPKPVVEVVVDSAELISDDIASTTVSGNLSVQAEAIVPVENKPIVEIVAIPVEQEVVEIVDSAEIKQPAQSTIDSSIHIPQETITNVEAAPAAQVVIVEPTPPAAPTSTPVVVVIPNTPEPVVEQIETEPIVESDPPPPPAVLEPVAEQPSADNPPPPPRDDDDDRRGNNDRNNNGRGNRQGDGGGRNGGGRGN